MVPIPANANLLRQILTGFVRNEICKTGLTKAIIGLSGGVDSAQCHARGGSARRE